MLRLHPSFSGQGACIIHSRSCRVNGTLQANASEHIHYTLVFETVARDPYHVYCTSVPPIGSAYKALKVCLRAHFRLPSPSISFKLASAILLTEIQNLPKIEYHDKNYQNRRNLPRLTLTLAGFSCKMMYSYLHSVLSVLSSEY